MSLQIQLWLKKIPVKLKNPWQISFLKKYFLVCQLKQKNTLKITVVIITYKDLSVTYNI